ncbi:MAG: hypothetical protein IKL40_06390 [Clostridia bacterium]|nr:hypothetical protein [Clostridia bacterium]
MKRKIYNVICFVICLIMCLMTLACSNQEIESGVADKEQTLDEPTLNYDENMDYSIVSENGNYSIIFDNPTEYQINNQKLANISFPSMKNFKDSVTKGLLTDSQKQIMATSFKKNADGSIKSCDFNNLYVPILPETGNTNRVGWSGQSYSFSLSFENGISGTLSCLTESQFESNYQMDYVDVLNRETITITKTESLGDGKTAIYHSTSTGKLKKIRYSLTIEEKTIIVDKTFRLQMDNPNLETSDTIPSDITMYCTENGQNYTIYLYGFTEDPTDSWLSKFGITAFKDADFEISRK